MGTDAPTAWRAYFEASALLTTELERRLKQHCDVDLADFNLLLLLSEAPEGRMRMGELARSVAFNPGRLTYRISALERRGWVQREAVADDRRGSAAVLTDDGRRAIRRLRPIHARHVEELFLDGVTAHELQTLAEVFAPLRSRLLQTAPPPPDC